MTDLKKILKELEKDPDDVEARLLIEGFVRELEKEARIMEEREKGIVMPDQSHNPEIWMLRRVIGEGQE